jgi:hypothetical protein
MLVPTTSFAQYASSPFYDHTVALSQAYGIEALVLRLDLATEFSAPYDDELAETLEEVTGPDYARFKGTLGQQDPALAADLATALAEVAEAVEAGIDVTEAVTTARELLAKAYAAIIPAEVRDTDAFTGGVMLNLLLAEGGVAEGYEEAVENAEPWEYPLGWAALQRVKALWTDVAAAATPQQLEDGEEMLAQLDTLYPQAEPGSMVGLNPEEAESPSQRLGGILETVVNADLYPGRELPRLAAHLATVTEEACAIYAEQPEIAAETIYAVYDLYDAHLADVAGLFAPEAEEQAGTSFAALISADDGDDEREAEASGDAEEEEGEEQRTAAESCTQISETLMALKTALGG